MTTRRLKVGSKMVGDGCPCFITFEAGPTHNGLESALNLIQLASDSGADAIKFQIFNPDELIADKEQLFTYSILLDKTSGETKEVSEPLYNIFQRRSLASHEWKLLKSKADELDILFFATAGSPNDIFFLADLGCHSVKIASADINYTPLLKSAAESGMVVQIDTGSSDITEIDDAVQFLNDHGCNEVIIHQCPSGYPARLESIYLSMIPALKKRFPTLPIAYSDHTPDADMDIAALALGANLIEKTITANRLTPSVEHIFSLEPDDMCTFIQRIRDIEIAAGDGFRSMTQDQKNKRNSVRRSPYLTTDAPRGTALRDVPVRFMRPAAGITPIEWQNLVDSAILSRDCSAGSVLSMEDIL